MSTLVDGVTVTHKDRSGRGVIADCTAPAWTPAELIANPPAPGMMKVRWSDSVDRSALFWEYVAELTTMVYPVSTGRFG